MPIGSSICLDDLASHGCLDDHGIRKMLEDVSIMIAYNQLILGEESFFWDTYLRKRNQHWIVFLCPSEPDVRTVRIDTDLFDRAWLEAHVERDAVYVDLPLSELKLAFDLVTAAVPDTEESPKFTVRLRVHPAFDTSRTEVSSQGLTRSLCLQDVATSAAKVIGSFDSYGKVGANCQHFAIDFIKDIGADCSWLITDDERAAQATGGIVGTGYVVGGAVKAGLSYFVIGCSAVALGHIGLGVAIAGCTYGASRWGYRQLAQQHRNRADSEGENLDENFAYDENTAKPDALPPKHCGNEDDDIG